MLNVCVAKYYMPLEDKSRHGVDLSSPLELMKENCERCPICEAPSSFRGIEGDNVECASCGSQWHFSFEPGKPTVTLTKTGKDGFRIWLHSEKPVEYWKDMLADRRAGAFERGAAKLRPVVMVTGFVGGLLLAFGLFAGAFTIQTWQGGSPIRTTQPYIGYSYPLLILGIMIPIVGSACAVISGLLERQRAR